jgi:hypothetical protein
MPRRSKADSPPYEISPRVEMQAATEPYAHRAGAAQTRPLRIFTLDPSLSSRTGGIATVNVPYEDLQPGPAGRLFEVDPTGVPKPLKADLLDLDDKDLLLQDGLRPSPAHGQFHLQMVYAVCNLTYGAFRRALGREIAWACGVPVGPTKHLRLRVRPFAFKEDNAYYDRTDNGLSFGYFNAGRDPAGHTAPRGLIFAALSHDIIAHETTHALLDGLRSQFYDPVQPDVLGFHEGFADIVAYFLHFTYPDVVEQAIRESSGLISHATLLTNLAAEFGYAASSRGQDAAMRSAVDVEGIAAFDSDTFAPGHKGPTRYRKNMEAHDLGSVLVSAVFEAYATIFRRKTERLLDIAGVAPSALGTEHLSSALTRALAEQASEVAGQFLNVCIRAIDYCPPVDMELCEYLRALITADVEVVPDDRWGYREALMRSFRRRRLFPDHVGFMTEDALKWQAPEDAIRIPGLAFSDLRFNGDPALAADEKELRRQADALGVFVSAPKNAPLFHLVAPGTPLPKGIQYASPPRVESIRCARRVSPDGRVVFDLVAEVLQTGTVEREKTLFDFTGGCTIVIDPSGQVRYIIHKRLGSADRQDRQFQAMRGPLKRFWVKKGRKFQPRAQMLKTLHQGKRARRRPA